MMMLYAKIINIHPNAVKMSPLIAVKFGDPLPFIIAPLYT
jgi:hypothetical protein